MRYVELPVRSDDWLLPVGVPEIVNYIGTATNLYHMSVEIDLPERKVRAVAPGYPEFVLTEEMVHNGTYKEYVDPIVDLAEAKRIFSRKE